MDDLLERAKAGEEIEVRLYQHMTYGHFGIVLDDMPKDYMILAKGKAKFSMRDDDKVIAEAVEAFDYAISQAYADAERKVSEIKDRKARFLAIGHDGK